MAGIDYNIPLQFKGIQIELPENAMARAMQMRQLQESSELNALRRQDAQEAAQLRRQELQFRTQEAKTKEEERKRVLSKEQLVEAVADLTSYDTVESVLAGVRQKVADGLVTQAQADKVIAGLPKNDFELPAWQIRTMRSLLPAKEQYAELKAARDAAYEDYADTEAFAGRQPLLRDAWERPTAPAVAAPSAEAAPAPATTTLTTTPEVTSPQGFGPVVPGMSYDDYRNKSISVNQERVLGKEAYEAEQQRLAQMGQTAPANALAANVAPANALVNPPAAVKEEMALPSVAVQGKRFGFDYLDPQAQILYERAAKTKDKDKAATYRAIAKEIQDANVAALKERQLTGGFLNVYNAEKLIADLEKEEQTPLVKRQIATLREAIRAENEGRGVKVTVPVNVSTEKKFGEAFAGKIADEDVKLKVAAEDAPNAAATANRVMSILQSGQVFTGSAANIKLQMAKLLKLGGGSDSEAIANTEVLISSLADTTLGAIRTSGLGSGQGFTNSDRDFLEKAKAGQITYDAVSLQRLAKIAHRAAEATAEKWNKRVKSIPQSAIEGTGISTEPIVVPTMQGAKSRAAPAMKNSKGWTLEVDKNGNRAYVSPDRKQFEEVK